MRRIRTVTLKHVQTVRQKNGTVKRYLRIPGKARMKLPDLPPDHPDFLLAYAVALKDAVPPPGTAGTIDDVRRRTTASHRFKSLSESYRKMMTREFDAICKIGGHAIARDLRDKHIRQDMSKLTPVQAKKRLSAWRLLCQIGKEQHVLDDDPSETVKRMRMPTSDGFAPWTLAEIDAYRAKWPNGTIQRWAMELIYWTGARTCDAVRIGPGMIDADGVLAFKQKKTGKFAYVPWRFTPHFTSGREFMEAAYLPSGQMTFLATEGKTRSVKGLGNLISDAAKKAGLVERSAHGLRKSRAIALAEGGATTHELASWTGHRSLAEVERYTAEVDRRKAVMGQTKRAKAL